METVGQIRARWRTRRLMAWVAFWTLVAIVPAAFWMADAAEKVAGVIQLVAPSLAAIIMVYIAAAAYDDVHRRSDSRDAEPAPGARQTDD